MTIHRFPRRFKQPERRRIGQAINLAWCLAASTAWTSAHGQAAVSPAAPAAAASAAPTSLEIITVTARKRDELLQDVPISIQAYSEKTLRASGAYDLQDLQRSSGFTVNSMGGNSAGGRTLGNLTMRGLQGNTYFLPNEASGGVFIDGIYVSTGISSVNTRDAQRIEVLKGPQNAFFGRNTFGGAINIITKNPSNTFRGEVNASASNLGSSDTELTLEGPLIADMLNGRLTLLNHVKAKQYTASDGGPLGEEKTQSASGTLYFTPSSKLWVRLRGQYQQDDDSQQAVGWLASRLNTSCTGRTYTGKSADGVDRTYTLSANYFCDGIPQQKDAPGVIDMNTVYPAGARAAYQNNSLNDPFRKYTPSLDHTGMRRNVSRASAQLGYELPAGFDLAANIGWNRANSSSIWDLDRTTSPNYMNFLALATRDLTADVRVSSDPTKPLRGLLGVSSFSQRYQFAQLDYDNYTSATAVTIRDTNSYIDNKSSVPAAYGSIEYDVLPNLTLAGDVRYQKDKLTTFNFARTAEYTNEVKNWLPRASIRFKPMADLMVYATYAKGVQQLAFNSGYINANDAQKAYIQSQIPGVSEYSPQPKLDSYELGVKQSLLNNRLQYSLAVYDQKWKNRVTSTVLLCPVGVTPLSAACPLPASGSSATFGNDVTIKGFELSIDAAPTPQWSFGAYIDYKQAVYDREYLLLPLTAATNPRVARFDGKRVPLVPEWSGQVNSTFRTALPSGWSGYVRGDITYTGKTWDSDANIFQNDDYFRVGLRLGIEKAQTTVELYAKNLFDDRHWNYAYRSSDLSGPFPGYFSQGVFVTAPDRREIGMRVRYVF